MMGEEKEISEEEIRKGVRLLFGGIGGIEEKEVVSSETVDELDEAAEAESVKKIEAAMFISGRYLSIQELVTLTDVNPILLKKLLADLEDKFKESGIDVIREGEKWKMDVAAEYRDVVNRLATGESEFSRAEQETLAIIAYKQPMKQSVLVKIRGNKAYDHVKRFVEIGLIVKKRAGHTSELNLSDSFYDYFHLVKGEPLPDA
jgi:segregation and condensation protein B